MKGLVERPTTQSGDFNYLTITRRPARSCLDVWIWEP
jgi:hypothetical protein